VGNAAGGFMDGIDGWIEGIGTLRESVQQLTISGIGNLENALVELVTTGKTSFRQLAVSILQDTARMIIQQLVLANVLRMVQNLFGGFGGGGGLFGGLFADGGVFPSGLSFNPGAFAPGVVLNANGNAFGKGGIQPFAQGGVVTQPTLFQFAGGGAMRNGLMGEAGPEAIMPLRRGRDGKLGVMAGGGGTSVVVNVDASGTRAQGDSSRANMVGRELGAFVEQKILEMKRPGGLLAAT
jgi:lambda family phage tail tape measure protein